MIRKMFQFLLMIKAIPNIYDIKINIKTHSQQLLKCLLTVIGSSPLFLLAGSNDIFGTDAL